MSQSDKLTSVRGGADGERSSHTPGGLQAGLAARRGLALSNEQRDAIEHLVTAAIIVAAVQDQRTPYGLLSGVAQRAGAALLEAEFAKE